MLALIKRAGDWLDKNPNFKIRTIAPEKVHPIAPEGVGLCQLLRDRAPETWAEITEIRTGAVDQLRHICDKHGIPFPNGDVYFDTAFGQVKEALEKILPALPSGKTSVLDKNVASLG
jgi:hypothetical protein